MKSSSISLVIVTVLPLLTAAFPATDAHSLISRLLPRQESQTEFDEETTSFTAQGLCRAYETNDLSLMRTGLSTCSKKCGGLVNDGNISSVTCVSGGISIPTTTGPAGNKFTMGECECNVPLIDQIVLDVLLSLPAIAKIGCELLYGGLDLIIQLGALAIPGEGEAMDAGMFAVVQGTKILSKNGYGSSFFLKWLANPCSSSNYTTKIDNIWGDMKNVSDDVVPA